MTTNAKSPSYVAPTVTDLGDHGSFVKAILRSTNPDGIPNSNCPPFSVCTFTTSPL